jgi:hypothetical protein
MTTSHHRICFGVAVFAAALIWLARPANGQDPFRTAAQNADERAAEADNDDFVLRTYDVGDLVLNVPDYPYPGGSGSSSAQSRGPFGGAGFGGGGGGLGGGGGGFFSVADDENRTVQNSNVTLDVLTDAIISTVASDSWAENGGGEADIRPVGNSLVIWQSQSAHARIADLLDQLRSVLNDRRTIRVDARWLLLNSDELDRLTATNAEFTLDRKQLESLTRRRTTIRGLTNCFSGQLVYVVSGTRRNFVSGYIPVVGSVESPRGDAQLASLHGGARVWFVGDQTAVGGGNERSVGYQPIVEKTTRGALLEIRPTVVRGSKSAIVDLRSTLTIPGGQALVVLDKSDETPGPPVVDRIAMDTQEFATTMRVPLGEPVLVGGLTYVPPALGATPDADPTQPKAAALESPQYYLILELR